MESLVRKQLIIKPVIFACAVMAGALFCLLAIELTINQALNHMAAVDVATRFPWFVFVIIPLLVSLPAWLKVVGNLSTLHGWQTGKSPACPDCYFPMKKRMAKRGRYKGHLFWGCVRYPICDETQKIQ